MCHKEILFSLVLSFALFILPSISMGQSGQDEDVIYLKNGNIIRGEIKERVGLDSIKIMTSDGSIFVHSMSDIDRISKEPTGTASLRTPTGKKKYPLAALFLSAACPGAGQFYNGETKKGLIMLGVAVTGVAVSTLSAEGEDDFPVVAGFVMTFAASIYSIIDAVGSAHRINRENGWGSISPQNKTLAVGLMARKSGGRITPMVAFSCRF